jgi:hypothetical protein
MNLKKGTTKLKDAELKEDNTVNNIRILYMRGWDIGLAILIMSIMIGYIFNRGLEPFKNPKGYLYLLLEAPGFDVPELNVTKQIMNPLVAQAKFDKVVVVANSAKYKEPSDGSKMTDQWDHQMVKDLGLTVEKWVFVCCDSSVTPATRLITNLLNEFPDIKGFLIDSEDGTIPSFVEVFNNLGPKYQYAIVGGTRNSLPPQSKYGIMFDKFFSEVYTEGTNEMDRQFYDGISKKVDGAMCVSMNSSSVVKFWKGVKDVLGANESIVPTVCGSGDCQELLFGNDCFDERLSGNNIGSLLNGNTSGRKNFAIWYGTGQQFSCEPAQTCLRLDSTNCMTNKKCIWNPYKTNPNTHKPGICSSVPINWGCSTTW